MCAPEEKEIKMKCVSIGYKFGIVLILLFQINASRNRIKELKSEMSLKQIGLVFSDLYRVKLRFSFQFTIASRREIFSKTGLDFKKSSTDPPNANIFRFSRASSSFLFRGCSSTRLLPPKLQIREVYDVCHETSLASCAIKFSGNPSRSEVTPADIYARCFVVQQVFSRWALVYMRCLKAIKQVIVSWKWNARHPWKAHAEHRPLAGTCSPYSHAYMHVN